MGVVWRRTRWLWQALVLGVLQLVLQARRVGIRWRSVLRSSRLDVPVSAGQRASADRSVHRYQPVDAPTLRRTEDRWSTAMYRHPNEVAVRTYPLCTRVGVGYLGWRGVAGPFGVGAVPRVTRECLVVVGAAAGTVAAAGLAAGHGLHRVGEVVKYRCRLLVGECEGWEEPYDVCVAAGEFDDEAATQPLLLDREGEFGRGGTGIVSGSTSPERRLGHGSPSLPLSKGELRSRVATGSGDRVPTAGPHRYQPRTVDGVTGCLKILAVTERLSVQHGLRWGCLASLGYIDRATSASFRQLAVQGLSSNGLKLVRTRAPGAVGSRLC